MRFLSRASAISSNSSALFQSARLACFFHPGLHRFALQRAEQCGFQRAHRDPPCSEIHAGSQTITRLAGLHHQAAICDPVCRRAALRMPVGKMSARNNRRDAAGEILQHAVKGLTGSRYSASCIAQCNNGRSSSGRPSSSKRLSVAEHRYRLLSTSPRRAEIFSLRFRLPPNISMAASAAKRKGGGIARQLLVIALVSAIGGHLDAAPAGQTEHQRAHRIAHAER